MKKILWIMLLTLVLTSCGQSRGEIDAAKKDLLGDTVSQQDDTQPDASEDKKSQQSNSLIQIMPQDTLAYLVFDSISERELTSGEVIISGTTNIQVDKIQVLFTNPTSKYPDDDYTLQAFKSGDTTFKYIASSKNQVLDFGQNEYIFRAWAGKEISETKIVLNVLDENNKETIGSESTLVGPEDNTISIDLPTSSKYGEPLMLWEESFTYTQIKGFEVKKEILPEISCETLTDYLWERMNVWYYWNTCRDIVKEKWIKFNVIRLDGEKYVYERHYVDFTHGFYGIYELETGVDVTSENISDKNQELKEREFPSLEIVDDLMKDIVNS